HPSTLDSPLSLHDALPIWRRRRGRVTTTRSRRDMPFRATASMVPARGHQTSLPGGRRSRNLTWGGPPALTALLARSPLPSRDGRSEEHTSELQSLTNLVCR